MKKSENGIDFEDDEDDDKIARQAAVERKKKLAEMNKSSYFEEQEEIKKSLKQAIGSVDAEAVEDEEDTFLQIKSKSNDQIVNIFLLSNCSISCLVIYFG